MKENNVKTLMIGLCVIAFIIGASYVMSPTNFSVDVSMDDNTLEAIKIAGESHGVAAGGINEIIEQTLDSEFPIGLPKTIADIKKPICKVLNSTECSGDGCTTLICTEDCICDVSHVQKGVIVFE